jgi:putative FmdB family regulatory protein
MPIYEYRCESCDHELETIQKMSDAPLVVCPECKQESLKKLISAAGFRLKGSGWYETDFKNGTKKNVHDSGKSESKSKGCTDNSCACNGH